jgi:hypothetical protein
MSDDLYSLALLNELGLGPAAEKPKVEEGPDIFQPIRTAFGATQNVGGQLIGAFDPEAYAAAQEELRKSLGVTEVSPWYEKVEAAPGLGDVLAQEVPTSIRESIPGRIVGPVARMAGNILGDPTTYTPAILGKAGGLLAKGVKGAEPIIAASEVAVRGAEEAVRAGVVGREALAAVKGKAARDVYQAVLEHGSPIQAKAYKALGFLHDAEPAVMGSAAALAFGPRVAESAFESLKDTMSADSISEGLVSGANTVLMAGLGILMGKGLISAVQAKSTLGRAVAEEAGVKLPEAAAERPALPLERPAEAPPVEVPVPEAPRANLAEEMVAQRDAALAAETERLNAELAQLEQAGVRPQEAEAALAAAPRTEAGEGLPAQLETIPEAAPIVEVAPRTPEVPPAVVPPRTEGVEAAPLAQVLEEVRAKAGPKPRTIPQVGDLLDTTEADRAFRHVFEKLPEERQGMLRELAENPELRPRLAATVRDFVDQAERESLQDRGIPASMEARRAAYHKAFREVVRNLPEPMKAKVAAAEVVAPEIRVRPLEQAPGAVAVETPKAAPGRVIRARPVQVEVPLARGAEPVVARQLATTEGPGKAPEASVAPRIFEAIPEENRAGVLERFGAARQGQKIQTTGGEMKWGTEAHWKRWNDYAALRAQGVPRDVAIKDSKGAVGVAAQRNLVGAFEKSLTDFFVREKGVVPPEQVRGVAAAAVTGLKEQKAALDARFPAVAEAKSEEMAGLLRDYSGFIKARKEAYKQGLSPRDQALWDVKLKGFAAELGLKLPAATNAQVVVGKIARKLGVDLKAPAVEAPVVAAAPVAPVKFQMEYKGRRKWGTGEGGSRVEFVADEARLETVKSPEGAAKDLSALIEDPKVRFIQVGDLKQTATSRAEFRRAVDAALVDEAGNTKAAWRVDGETIEPIRKVAAEIEEPRIEAAQIRKARPDGVLSTGERGMRHRHYLEDEGSGVDLGEGLKVVDHDRKMGAEFAQKVAETGKDVGKALKGIADELGEIHEEGIEFGGLTTSPYLSGLYHDRKLYVNVVEAVHAGGTREKTVDKLLYTAFHEAAHARGFGHDMLHSDYARYIQELADDEGRFGEYRERLMQALPKETFEKIRSELVPEFRKRWEEIDAESWRRAEGQPGVLGRNAPGGTPAVTGRLGGGPEVAEGGGAARVQPGGAVQRGEGGEAGGVRPAAAVGRGVAEGAVEGEGAGPAAGGEAGTEKGRVEVLETRPGTSGRGISQEDGKRLINEIVAAGKEGRVPLAEVHRQAFDLAGNVVDGMTPEEVKAAANSIPAPKPGQMEASLNLVRMADLSERTKAQTKVWYDLTEGKWARDKVEHWTDLGEDVQRLLGLDNPESYAAAIKKRGGALTSKDVMLMRTVTNEMGARIEGARDRYYEAMDDPKATVESQKKVFEEWKKAEASYRNAALTTSEGLTGVARALAIAKAELTRMDPKLQFENSVRAGLREKMHQRFRDKVVAEEKTNELFGKLMDIFHSKDTMGQSEKSFDEFRKAYSQIVDRGIWPDKVLEWYKAGLLGWPSQVANLGGNTLFRASRFVEDVIAGALDATSSKLLGTERQIYVGENAVALLGMRRALVEGWKDFEKDGSRLFQLKGPNMEKALKHGSVAEDLLQYGGTIAGKKGNFVRFHIDLMGISDNYSKLVSQIDSLYRQTYRNLRKGGVEGFQVKPGENLTSATERIVGELRENHKQWLTEQDFDFQKLKRFEPMLKEAEEAARRDTFQEELPGAARAIQQVFQRHPILQFLVPFFRTPTNIARETIKRTPMGFLGVAKNWAKMTQAERVSALSKPIMGSSVMALMMTAAATGEVTGGGPTNPEAQDALKAIGWQPYSLRVGNQWFSYQRLEPLASLMGFAADYVEATKRGEVKDPRAMAEKAFASIAENLTNKTFLSSLTGFASALSDPKQNLPGFVKQLQGSAIPNSIGFIPFGHLARALDPVYRQTEVGTLQPFIAKIPGLSQTLAPQYGPTGAVRTRTGTAIERLVSPYQHQVQQTGPKAIGTDEIIRLNTVPKTPMKYWTSPQGFQVALQPGERQRLAKAMNEAVTMIGQKLVKDPSYQRLPDNENDPRYRFGVKTKEDVVRKMLTRYRTQAMSGMKGNLKARAKQVYKERTT